MTKAFRGWKSLAFGIAVIAACLLLNGRSTRADEWKPITPDELKMTSLAEAPGAPAVILYREVNRDDGRTPHEDNYVRIKVLTEEGRKYANVEIPFFKDSGNVHGVKGRSVRPNGTVVPFDGKVVEQTIVKAKGVKYLAKTFTLPDVQVGSVIEYHYTIDFNEGYVYDSRWILSEELFTKQAKFSLKANQDFALRWSWPLGLPTGTLPPKDERGTINMESSNIPAFQTEDYMPPETTLKYRVDFIYSEGFPEKDPAKFWKDYAKKQYGSVEEFVNKKKAMEQAVAQIISAGDSPEVKLQKIYARVQQLRNISFEREKTEQELKREKQKEVNDVEDVWKRSYGGGRQITWLFLGLARAAGFEASPVLVSRRNVTFFNNAVMNSRELDDNFVQVMLNAGYPGCKELWYYNDMAIAEYVDLNTGNAERRKMTNATSGAFPFDGDSGVYGQFGSEERSRGKWRIHPAAHLFDEFGCGDWDAAAMKARLEAIDEEMYKGWHELDMVSAKTSQGGGTAFGEMVWDFINHVRLLSEDDTHLYSAFAP